MQNKIGSTEDSSYATLIMLETVTNAKPWAESADTTIVSIFCSLFMWIIINFQIQFFRKKSCQPLWFFISEIDNEITRQDKWKFITIDNPIPNLNCIVQFKRQTVPKGGVAFYQNNNNVTNIMTPNIE